jgi:hypothetical protein
MFVETRDEARRYFVAVWGKMQRQEALGPLEAIIAQIIREHPEYQALLEQPERALDADFADGGNPFLHMGLHVALAEQLQADRPPGIRALYQRLLAREPDRQRVEHGIIGCLAASLRQAASTGTLPDEAGYLDCVRQLLR